MSENIVKIPIIEIEGIGPATAEKLEDINVFTLVDLLRIDLQSIHEQIKPRVSLDKIWDWFFAAQMMQVSQVSAQWAEGLVRGGIRGLYPLARTSYDRVSEVLADAKHNGIIPDAPDASEICAILQEASRLAYTGMVDGVVLADNDEPLAGAKVGLGVENTVSGEDGSFRLLGIPFDSEAPMMIELDGYSVYVRDKPEIVSTISVKRTLKYVLSASSAPNVYPVISESDGIPVRAVSGQNIRLLKKDSADLFEGETFYAHSFYEDGDVRMVSHFRKQIGVDLVVNYAKIDKSLIDGDINLDKAYEYRQGVFKELELSDTQLRKKKAHVMMVRKLGDIDVNQPVEERASAIFDKLKYLEQLGYFRSIRR